MRANVRNILQYGFFCNHFLVCNPSFSPSNALFRPKTCRIQKNIVSLPLEHRLIVLMGQKANMFYYVFMASAEARRCDF
jgi:hypothetical protein